MARSCHDYPVQNGISDFWAKIHVSNAESVLEAGKSTWGEGGVVGKVDHKRSVI